MISTNIMGEEFLLKAITAEIEKRIESEVRRLIKDSQHALERKIPEIVSGVALRVTKHIDLKSMNNVITIKILDEEKTPMVVPDNVRGKVPL